DAPSRRGLKPALTAGTPRTSGRSIGCPESKGIETRSFNSLAHLPPPEALDAPSRRGLKRGRASARGCARGEALDAPSRRGLKLELTASEQKGAVEALDAPSRRGLKRAEKRTKGVQPA